MCYKTRWVVKYNHQKYRVNYNKTYTSVVKTIYFQIIFKKATKKILKLSN